MERLCIKITGESGAGLLSTGSLITEGFKEMGFFVVADREYPSLIKGGHSCFTINVSRKPIFALKATPDIMLGIDKQSIEAYYLDLKKGGVFIYGYERPLGLKEIVQDLEARKCKIVHVMAREVAEAAGGNYLMTNVILVGMLWKVLGLPLEYAEKAVEKEFVDKPKLLPLDLACVKAGYEGVEMIEGAGSGLISGGDFFDGAGLANGATAKKSKRLKNSNENLEKILIEGNRALALGAIHAGCRAYYAYPMSPSSTILSHMSEMAGKTGMLVKQGEDEITVANMTVGSMFMGTRALCATSGGGFDLMTETVSLAGMIECPLVVVVAQRPGPATGLPTWTAQADLKLAIYAGHGEFARVVIGVSDPCDCFELIQHAFNYAEKYQTVVIVLTEKVIAETIVSVAPFKQNTVGIERGLVSGQALKGLKNEDRYRVTTNGLSKRWIPGASSEAYYCANGDEHWEDGSLTEEAETSGKMYEKRMRKQAAIEKALPEPEAYGVAKGADISFVGWGSSRNVMRDVIARYAEKGVTVNYLHYAYLWPLKTGRLLKFFKENKNVHLIEGNYRGQLGNLVEAACGVKFKGRLLKWNGRPFFVEDVEGYVEGGLQIGFSPVFYCQQ